MKVENLNEKRYPTDEELMSFITEIEKEPLFAPAYLKEEILKSLEKQDLKSLQKQRQTKIQMFTYSLKITAGMAAALMLLFILPQIPQEYRWPVRIASGWEEALKQPLANPWAEEPEKATEAPWTEGQKEPAGEPWAEGAKEPAGEPWTEGAKEPIREPWKKEESGVSAVLQNGTAVLNDATETIFNGIKSINQLFNQEEVNNETRQEE